MQTAIVPSSQISLKNAMLTLRRMRRQRFGDAAGNLTRLLNFARYAQILNHLDRDAYLDLTVEGVNLSEVPENGAHEIEDRAMEAIAGNFPLDYGAEEQFSEVSAWRHVFWIEPQGFPYTWDDWDENVSNPEEFNDRESIYCFCKSLAMGVDDETWLALAERFGWDCPPVDLNGKWNDEKLWKILERAGLGQWKLMFEICWCGTGNVFMDYDPQDPPMVEISLENFHRMKEDYEKCQEIHRKYNRVLQETNDDPTIFHKVATLFSRNFKRERVRVRTDGRTMGRTLAEVFAEEEERGYIDIDPITGNGAIVIDPFYGPIG